MTALIPSATLFWKKPFYTIQEQVSSLFLAPLYLKFFSFLYTCTETMTLHSKPFDCWKYIFYLCSLSHYTVTEDFIMPILHWSKSHHFDFQFSSLIFPQTFDATSSVQNDVTLTNEELALYNQLLLANNYLGPNDKRRRR